MIHGHEIQGGGRARVFRRRFSSLPLTVTLRTKPLASGDMVDGTVERIGSRWIFGRTRSTVPLEAEVEVKKGFWDTFFDVEVAADTDVTVRVDAPSMRGRALIWGLAAVVVVAATTLTLLAALG